MLADGRLIDFEPGNTEQEAYAVAINVGTTTLAAVLVDLARGRELAVAARLNPQTRFGNDVLSRILYCQQAAGGLDELNRAVVEAVNEMVGELAAEAGVARERIYEITFSGNTTMQQLLLRIDPQHLGEAPFVPATSNRVVAPAACLGLQIHRRGRAYVLPVIGGFVGGDTVSGILATGLVDSPGPALLVNIGTNGEIVLWANGRLTAASTAAGPAFEGARISQGMRASIGAIEKVMVNGSLRINVIGDVPPVGLCGSALVELGRGATASRRAHQGRAFTLLRCRARRITGRPPPPPGGAGWENGIRARFRDRNEHRPCRAADATGFSRAATCLRCHPPGSAPC